MTEYFCREPRTMDSCGNPQIRPNFRRWLILSALFLLFASCGLEDYPYLEPIPINNITYPEITKATIRLPNYNDTYFRGFKIYYRIYISDIDYPAVILDTEEMRLINSSLQSDFIYFRPRTDPNSTATNTNFDTLFKGRQYYELALEDADIDSVLFSASSTGGTIVLNFPYGIKPADMEIIESGTGTQINQYTLYRSDVIYDPQPDRYFLNTPELYSSDNAYLSGDPTKINIDVADTAATQSSSRYTFAAFYIVVRGYDGNNMTDIYSIPSFIGILRLPNI
jgi:hypothetical protein